MYYTYGLTDVVPCFFPPMTIASNLAVTFCGSTIFSKGTGLVIEVGDGVAQTVRYPKVASCIGPADGWSFHLGALGFP